MESNGTQQAGCWVMRSLSRYPIDSCRLAGVQPNPTSRVLGDAIAFQVSYRLL
ncbi:hypothetical protein [Limnospira platensis]|uniref:hypothetical protein n=1 Tax=Limnospira platensis TaxID=118562 RepID=UPI0001D0E640|nr:hypothetical protein AP9108_07285 [Arthrospira sp. PCC 9108]QQW30494.1 hypothetical protein AP9108_07290 [Arthrospira sp. PCC 9108]QQW30495.1 hypothetical protein AP9108_07295 [Arthrospira sp. PCC 9108]BAI89385.1 hypothetical protein NIES39_C05190 [Arthrospira platensis NIES-39]BAI89386.1 hypothetical protein NIES39_C05200 [Arthrospira platensis NIES-39]